MAYDLTGARYRVIDLSGGLQETLLTPLNRQGAVTT